MPKLNLRTARRIKTADGEVLRLKGQGFEWAKPAWTPEWLFRNGAQGAWYDPSDLSTMFQDAAGTIPVTGVEQPVGLILDKSGNGNHALQATTPARPMLRMDLNGRMFLAMDGVDDFLEAIIPTPFTARQYLALAVRLLSSAQGHVLRAESNEHAGWNAQLYVGSLSRMSLRSYTPYSAAGLIGVGTEEPTVLDGLTFNDEGEIVVRSSAGASNSPSNWTGDEANGTATVLRIEGPPTEIYGAIYVSQSVTEQDRALVRSYLAEKSGASA